MSLPAGFGRNLRARVLTALVALPALLAALLLGPPLLGVAVVGLAVLLGLHEFYGLLRARQMVPLHKTGLQLNLALSYGGRTESVDAVRALLRHHDREPFAPAKVDKALVASYLYRPGFPWSRSILPVRTTVKWPGPLKGWWCAGHRPSGLPLPWALPWARRRSQPDATRTSGSSLRSSAASSQKQGLRL